METSPAKQEQQKAKWESRLLNDLIFIKKHGRYPISRRTILPVGGLVFFVLFLMRMAWPVFFVARESVYAAYILVPVCMLGISSVIMRYVNILKFRRIRTAFHVTENIALLTQFLKFQQLAYTQHPEAPEVFMIMSRALGGDDNYREVMIFIADDKQILINSHFVNQKFTITPPSRQYRQMAQMLQHWLNKHINNRNSTDVSFPNSNVTLPDEY